MRNITLTTKAHQDEFDPENIIESTSVLMNWDNVERASTITAEGESWTEIVQVGYGMVDGRGGTLWVNESLAEITAMLED